MDLKTLIAEAWQAGLSYSDFRAETDRLLAEGKSTSTDTGPEFLRYTELNNGRMDKWDKRFELSIEQQQQLNEWKHQEHWLLITEGWCGDSAHAAPIMEKMAAHSAKIELRVVFRDRHLALMDQFLTNGGRSIPKLIRLSAEDHRVISTWGPRPKPAQDLMLAMKADGLPKEEITVALQKWYAKDRGLTIAAELMN